MCVFCSNVPAQTRVSKCGKMRKNSFLKIRNFHLTSVFFPPGMELYVACSISLCGMLLLLFSNLSLFKALSDAWDDARVQGGGGGGGGGRTSEHLWPPRTTD